MAGISKKVLGIEDSAELIDNPSMQVSPLKRATVGILLIIGGLLVIIFYKQLRYRSFGKDWTGKYSRGGLLFTFIMSLIIGLLLIVSGILCLVGVTD